MAPQLFPLMPRCASFPDSWVHFWRDFLTGFLGGISGLELLRWIGGIYCATIRRQAISGENFCLGNPGSNFLWKFFYDFMFVNPVSILESGFTRRNWRPYRGAIRAANSSQFGSKKCRQKSSQLRWFLAGLKKQHKKSS